MITVVEQLMQMHIKALQELGVDLKKLAEQQTQKKKIDEMRGAAHAVTAAERGGVLAPLKVFAASPEDFFREHFNLRGLGRAVATTWKAPRGVKSYLEKADEFGCDLIVMGTHGKGRIAHAFLGSVAEKVLQRSKKPVFTIPLPEEDTDLTIMD